MKYHIIKKIQIGGHRKSTKNLNVSKKEYSYVDGEDFDWINEWKWSLHNHGYARRQDKESKKWVLLHRQIALKYHIVTINQNVDHISRNKLDNRKCNLRPATASENAWNSKIPKNNTSGYKSIYKSGNSSGGWVASIMINKKQIYLGYFKTKKEAAIAYYNASIKYHKEFLAPNTSME